MSDENTPNWSRVNQAYLVGELASIKQLFRTHDARSAPAPQASAPTIQASMTAAQSAATAQAAAHGRAAAPATWADDPAFADRPPALEFITQVFGLSPFERSLLLLCAAPELDQDCAELYASAQGDPARTRPTFGLALAALPGAHWSALAPDGVLRYWRLIELASGAMLTSAALQIDERILHFLLGVDHLDERLAHLIRALPATQKRQLAPSHARIASDIAALWSCDTALRDTPLVQLTGDTDDYLPILAAAAHECRTQAALLNAEHAPVGGAELDAFLRLWDREALLSGLGVLVIEREDSQQAGSAEDRRPSVFGFSRLLERVTGRVVLTGRQRATITARSALTIEVSHPTSTEQRLVWRSALRLPADPPASRVEPELDALAAQFDLSVRVIRAVAADAASVARDEDGADPNPVSHESKPIRRGGAAALAAAWDVCRLFLRDRMEGLAQRIETRAHWPDLVLPTAEMEVLHAIVAQVRQRRTVYESWGFAQKSGRGLGTSVLFVGPSGTGKTLAAEVLANEMRLDLYRIDLSAVVSKYIGESEKALRRVFDAAEDSGAILLFDEADALFGLRSPVKDSHDRYANIQVSYLLQRMEVYRGLAILTTNQKSALDPAFMRRLRFVVQFPFPDLEQRSAIWNAVFPESAPLEDLKPQRLAQLKVAGGNIRNIAMNAAFLAAEENRAIRMEHVLVATRAEYAKLERTLTASETAGWL